MLAAHNLELRPKWDLMAKPSKYSNYENLMAAAFRWPFMNPGFKIGPLPISLDDDIIPASIFDPSLREVCELLKVWPDGHEAVMKNVDRFWPLKTREGHGKGCISGNYPPTQSRPYRCIYVTIHDPVGCAEGILHETGHIRLHALGIGLEEHDGSLIQNESDELFVSPIRKDKLRPMSAVLHAQYSYMMVSELDLRLVEAGVSDALDYAQINVPRIQQGYTEIQWNAKWTKAGEDFFTGLSLWMFSINERFAKCVQSAAARSAVT